jgi:hypothetical protein
MAAQKHHPLPVQAERKAVEPVSKSAWKKADSSEEFSCNGG